MKRELKGIDAVGIGAGVFDHRKAHPDEKGTERGLDYLPFGGVAPHRKAHPDEKGTERFSERQEPFCQIKIARPIPMKRELKALNRYSLSVVVSESQGPSR